MGKYSDINKIKPRKSAFKLEQFGEDEFVLRPCTARILAEMNDNIITLEELLKTPSAENTAKAAMFLMEIDSARRFGKQEVEYMNVETGDIETKTIGGYRLLMDVITGFDDQMKVLSAVLRSTGFSEDQVKGIVEEITDSINKYIDQSIKEQSVKKKELAEENL